MTRGLGTPRDRALSPWSGCNRCPSEQEALPVVARILHVLLAVSSVTLLWLLVHGEFVAIPGMTPPGIGASDSQSVLPPTLPPHEVQAAVQAKLHTAATGGRQCAARVSAKPAVGPGGGFGETVPRPLTVAAFAPLLSTWSGDTSKAGAAVERWRLRAAEVGGGLLRPIAAGFSMRGGVVSSAARAAVSRHVTVARFGDRGDCAGVATGDLLDGAEAVLGVAVESRLWACAVVRGALELSIETPSLAEAVGWERLWQSPDYRTLLREWSRYDLGSSGGLCERGFGTESQKFLAAGVWGVTYARCIHHGQCTVVPHTIVKLAGLYAGTHWVDPKTSIRYDLSQASLAAGFDPSVEAYMNEAVRVLVTHGVTPHLTLGYATWVCDDFLSAKIPVTGVTPDLCDKKSARPSIMSQKEVTKVCTNILNEVKTRVQAKNLQIMAQEEVLLGMQDALEKLHDTKWQTPGAWHHAIAALIFEVAYTVAALQLHFPNFRHNDLSWYNIRTTQPINLTDPTVGSMFAPLNSTGHALTVTKYDLGDGIIFHIPNYGYSIRIADWDFVHADKNPRLRNEKVMELKSRHCGTTIPNRRLWTSAMPVRSKQVAERGQGTAKEDSAAMPLRKGVAAGWSCAKWQQTGCATFDFRVAEIPAPDMQAVLNACPKACHTSEGTVELVVDAPQLVARGQRTADDNTFRDSTHHMSCAEWAASCDSAQCPGNDLTAAEEAELFARCPVSCTQTAVDDIPAYESSGQRRFAVRIRGNAAVPDGVYEAVQTGTSAGTWRLQISVRGLPGINPDEQGAGLGSVEFIRRPWLNNITVTSKHRKNSFQRHLYTVTIAESDYRRLHLKTKDLIYIAGNGAVHPGTFQVVKVPPTASIKAGGRVMIDLESAEMNGTPPPRHDYHGGVLFRVAARCSAKYYEYSSYGITPVNNTRFDLHFMLNQLQDYMDEKDWKDYFPTESKRLVRKLFDNVTPNLRGWYKPLVHDYRFTDSHENWWCDRRGIWDSDNETIRGFQTPMEMLRSAELFAPFRGSAQTRPPGAVVANYSLNARLPAEFCIGTGELPARPPQ